MRRRVLIGSSLALVVVGGALVALVVRGLGSGAGDVPTTPAVRSDFVHRIWADGVVQAADATPLGPPPMTRGQLRIAWLAADGTRVKPGDVVIRFDPTDLETRLLEGRTERATADARIERTQVREASAGKNLERDAHIAGVELDYAQKYQSKDPDVFSRVDIAKSKIDADLAAARKENAEDVRGIKGELAEVEIDLLGIERRKADLKIAQAQGDLQALEVRAPHEGIFTLRDQWGQLPRVGTVVWGGNAVAELPRLEALEAKVFVLEADAGGLKAGVPATVVVDGRPDRVLSARVRSVDTLAQPRSFEVPVQYFGAVLDFDDPAAATIKPGQRIAGHDRARAARRRGHRPAASGVRDRGPLGGLRPARRAVRAARRAPGTRGSRTAGDRGRNRAGRSRRAARPHAGGDRARDEREGKDASAVAGAPRRTGP